jgi:hypothetical protein
MTLIDPAFRPGRASLLSRQHFQTAYVTNDMDQAIGLLADRYGVADFRYIRDVPLPTGGQMDIALAWVGNMNLEIIQGSGNPQSFYERSLPGSFAIRFHHLGYLVPSQEEWDDVVAAIEAQKLEIIYSGSDPSGLDFIYIEAPGLGHFLEYIRPKAAWIDLFESLPRN